MNTLQNLSKILVVVLFGTLLIFAAKQTVEFEVKGACGMCETRIERTANGIDGVKKADWTLEDNVLKLKFDDKKTSVVEVRKALAAVGHDNGDFRAPDEVYENLPACCHYEREEAGSSTGCGSGNCGEEKEEMSENKHGSKENMAHEKHEKVHEEKSECESNCGEEEASACESGTCE